MAIAAATMVCGWYLVLVLTACRGSALRTGIRSLASNPSWHAGDCLLQEPTSAAPAAPQEERQIEYSPFVNGSITRVTLHTPRANATAGKDCRSVITDLVVGSDELYYILHQYCRVDGTLEDRALSIRRLNLSQVQDGNGPSPQEDDSLISYMWPYGQPNGTIIREPADFGDAHVTGMGLSKDGMHLVLSVTNGDPKVTRGNGTISGDQNRSRFTSLSLADGYRSSSDPLSTLVQAWTLESNKGFLYYLQSDSVLINVTVNHVGLPNGPLNQLSRLDIQTGIDPDEEFQPGSLLSDGSCLYSVTSNDGLFGRKLGDGHFDHCTFAAPSVPFLGKEMDVVATAQGCHVFTAADNTVAVFKLMGPCSSLKEKRVLPHYFGEADVTALALGNYSDGLSLYVGTSDGSVYHIPLNGSELSRCGNEPYSDRDSSDRYFRLMFFPFKPPSDLSSMIVINSLSTLGGTTYDLVIIFLYSPPIFIAIAIIRCTVFCVRGFVKRRLGALEQASNNHAVTGRPMTSSVQDCTPMNGSELSRCGNEPYTGRVLCDGYPSDGYSRSLKFFQDILFPSGLAGMMYFNFTILPYLTDIPFDGPYVFGYTALIILGHVVAVCIARSVRGFLERRRPALEQFGWKLLSDCTENFTKTYRIGDQGAFGKVYRGLLDGKDVAIKVMPGQLTDVKRNQFVAEVTTLSAVNHVNLVQLTGYCQEGNECILVYPGFSSAAHRERMSIGFQIARGLQYLHDDAKPPIIHRDIKSSDVLLGDGCGDKLYVVLADSGLAAIGKRVLDTGHDHVVITSHIGSTSGYMSPKYMLRGELPEKNDMAGDSTRQMVMNTFRLAWECVHEDFGSRPAMRAIVQRFHSMLLDVGWDFLIRTMDMEYLLAMSEAEDAICKDDDAESQEHHEVLLE
ncbi:hypothetical protein CBR_g34033 [Chara braunii]|uniref:Protein kinase domain-containing protein n=1 Tax=Chara braunii TaxID=69332 RepID=A0A388LHN7_CHABU|nr:hypothetical protein CBR_g34033 [Chara braunii]|eukprot:GBG81850.1 hypothetical protein CBR_g34033 [Chara braunii]